MGEDFGGEVIDLHGFPGCLLAAGWLCDVGASGEA
jgi:hypothetical protein